MNKTLREVVSTLYQNPMRDMSYVQYFKFLNEAGKITARSLMDGLIISYTYIEILENKNLEYEANFKEIEDILKALVEKKTEKPTIEAKPYFTGLEVLTNLQPKAAEPVVEKPIAKVRTPEQEAVYQRRLIALTKARAARAANRTATPPTPEVV